MLYRNFKNTMKKYFTLLFIVTIYSFAQNPDGKNVSLHLTPIWNWGDANFSQVTNVWYPNSLSSVESILSEEKGIIKYPLAFGLHTLIKVPTTQYLTFTLSYAFNQKFGDLSNTTEESKYFYQYWKLNGKMHSVSFTISLYNLFSVYQGD
jgi:hypothetical protein